MLWYVHSSTRTFVELALSLSLFIGVSVSHAANSPAAVVTASSYQVKSYREWKTGMISDAESRVKTLKDSIQKKRGAASSSGTEAGLSVQLLDFQNRLEREELTLSWAQDLTISDYFVGYLVRQKSLSAAIKEVSGRLSAEEVAELMTAYANNFFSSKPNTTVVAPHADSGL